MKRLRYFILIGILVLSGILLADDLMMKRIKINPVFDQQETLDIFITTDTHYLSKSLMDDGSAFHTYLLSGYGQQTRYSDELFSTLAMEIQTQKPEVLIISGDLTNNGEYKSHEDLVKHLKKIEENGTSVYVIPGNHDLNNPNARKFSQDQQLIVDSISPDSFVELYKDFGYDEAISKDNDTLSYLVAPQEKLWFLMIDTTESKRNYKEGKPEVDGDVSFQSWEWMRDCYELADLKGAKIIPVMHHSMINHSSFWDGAFTLKNKDQVSDLVSRLGSDIVLTGHIHNQDISSEIIGDKKIYDIATNSLTSFPNQYGILKYSEETGYRYITKELDVEGYAKLNNLTDPNLLNFETYSKDFFAKSSFDTLEEKLVNQGYLDEDINNLLDVLLTVNTHYSAGRENEITETIKEQKGYELWMQITGFWKDFIVASIQDTNEDDNLLEISNQIKK